MNRLSPITIGVLAVALSLPGFTQTVTRSTSGTITNFGAFPAPNSSGSVDLYLAPGPANHELVNVAITTTVHTIGSVLFVNAHWATQRVFRYGGTSWRLVYGCGGVPAIGHWAPYSGETPPLNPGESIDLPIDHTSSYTSNGVYWPLPQLCGLPFSVVANNFGSDIGDFSGGVPGGTGLPMWADGTSIVPQASVSNVNVSVTLTYEPEWGNVVDVCDSTHGAEITAWGTAGEDPYVVGTGLTNFGILFVGDFFQTPGSPICIGAGQRIHDAVGSGKVVYQVPETLHMGRSFTAQFVYRGPNPGEIRFSNAITITP